MNEKEKKLRQVMKWSLQAAHHAQRSMDLCDSENEHDMLEYEFQLTELLDCLNNARDFFDEVP